MHLLAALNTGAKLALILYVPKIASVRVKRHVGTRGSLRRGGRVDVRRSVGSIGFKRLGQGRNGAAAANERGCDRLGGLLHEY
jgi:hypothetical protein